MTSTADDVSTLSFADLAFSRHSVRAFLPDPVPAERLESVFAIAQQTASWCNAQSWQVDLTGTATTRLLADALLADVRANPAGGSDIPPPASYENEYAERRRGSGYALYNALGIARDDRPGRTRQMLRNYEFFGAPHVAIVSSPVALGPYGYVDCGGFVANVLNAAQSLGLGAIAQAAVVLRPRAIRSVLAIGEDRHLVCGIALGYEDLDDPANAFRTERATFDETVRIHP
ncbi:nitroreductase [Microbacterium sp. NPDC056044]|uniref:nitroreductase n=1 Tax=Microbacterium sp. NPDC056044 TaxID=3345690 RepID=UPI0035DB76C2